MSVSKTNNHHKKDKKNEDRIVDLRVNNPQE